MNFDELKNLIPQNGEKYIIVENGKPVLVLMNFEDYKKSVEDKLRQTPESAKANPEPKIKHKELTVEDLPF